MELMVFTLSTCTDCSAAKRISEGQAQRYRLRYREVDISPAEGQLEGLMPQIVSPPSIALDNDVVAGGKLVSREELETEVRKRLSR